MLQAISRIVPDSEAGNIFARQLAFENANSTCQGLIWPLRKKRYLSDFIRLCADVGPSYMQGAALAAILNNTLGLTEQPHPQLGAKSHFTVKCFCCG